MTATERAESRLDLALGQLGMDVRKPMAAVVTAARKYTPLDFVLARQLLEHLARVKPVDDPQKRVQLLREAIGRARRRLRDDKSAAIALQHFEAALAEVCRRSAWEK